MKKAAGRSVTAARIVEAAVRLFSSRGYKGTSTREIAHLAGLNEATLFRYFPRKAGLFWTATESRLNRLKLGRELQNGLAADVEPEIIVPMLVEFVVENVVQCPELTRLLYVAGFELPGAGRIFREHLGPIFDSVNAYFGRCSARGAIGDLDPTFATLGLAGAVSAHRNLHRLFTGRDLPWDVKAATPVYAQFWLNALRQPVPVSRTTDDRANEQVSGSNV